MSVAERVLRAVGVKVSAADRAQRLREKAQETAAESAAFQKTAGEARTALLAAVASGGNTVEYELAIAEADAAVARLGPRHEALRAALAEADAEALIEQAAERREALIAAQAAGTVGTKRYDADIEAHISGLTTALAERARHTSDEEHATGDLAELGIVPERRPKDINLLIEEAAVTARRAMGTPNFRTVRIELFQPVG